MTTGPAAPASRGRGGRLPLLLLLLALLGGAAAWVNGDALRRWSYTRLSADELLRSARRRPDDPVLAGAAAERLLLAGRAADAMELAAPLADRRPELALLAGRAAWAAGDMERAAPLLDAALKARPDHPDTRFWMGEFLYARGYAGAAQELLLEVVRLDPKHGRAWTRLGAISQETDNFAAALERLERAERYAPTAESARLRAAALRSLGRAAEAEAAARAAVQRDGSAGSRALLGEMLELFPGEARLRAAQAEYLAAVRLDPAAVETLRLLALNHRALGEHAAAVRVLRRALRRAPAMSEGYLLLGQEYTALDRPALAAACLAIYRRLEPLEAKVSQAEYRSNVDRGSIPSQLALARAYLEAGRQELARDVLQRVRRREPGHPALPALERRAQGPPTLRIPPLPPDPEGDAP